MLFSLPTVGLLVLAASQRNETVAWVLIGVAELVSFPWSVVLALVLSVPGFFLFSVIDYWEGYFPFLLFLPVTLGAHINGNYLIERVLLRLGKDPDHFSLMSWTERLPSAVYLSATVVVLLLFLVLYLLLWSL